MRLFDPIVLLQRVMFPCTFVVASPAPATVSDQTSRFSSLINNAVQGTVQIIQALQRPATVYAPPVAGVTPGGSTGAAQTPTGKTEVPTWAWWALGGSFVVVFLAAVFSVAKR